MARRRPKALSDELYEGAMLMLLDVVGFGIRELKRRRGRAVVQQRRQVLVDYQTAETDTECIARLKREMDRN